MNLSRRIRWFARRLTTRRVRVLDDCGQDTPGHQYRDRSFAGGEVSPDQAAVDNAIAAWLTPEHRVLHVGVGASSLARRYAVRTASIDGITVLADEVAAATALALPGYRVWIANKYGVGGRALSGPYDVIAENNPGSFACCRRHHQAWLDTLARLLAPGGCVVTHVRGARFCEPGGIAMSYRTFRQEGRRRGLTVHRYPSGVWTWTRADR